MTTTYPAGGITPHGEYLDAKGRYPTVHLASHDNTAGFYLLGGKSIPWPDQPECVQITRDGIKNLIPPWRRVAQKGATEDGESFIDSLKDPAEPDITVGVRARDPRFLQHVTKTLINSIDDKRTSRLTVTNVNGERWWADVRWNKPPQEPIIWGVNRFQRMTLRLLIDGAFWRSDADISGLGFQYESHTDEFAYDGPVANDWNIRFVGSGNGGPIVENGQVVWEPNGTLIGSGRSAIMRYQTYRAAADDVIVEMLLGGGAQGWALGDAAANALWLGMSNSGAVGNDGVRAYIRLGYVIVSSFVAGTEHVLKTQGLAVPPQHGDLWQLIRTGSTITVRRNGTTITTVNDDWHSSHSGSGWRAGGLEMHAGPTLVLPTLPAPVDRWTISSNNTTAQANRIQCINTGSEPMYRTHVLIGPGTFSVAVKPGSDDMVTMGPLLDSQVVYLRTDPRRTTIVDLTATPPTPQQLNDWQQAVKDLADFASGGNAPPLLQEIESWFGIRPPQGNLNSLLKGRFSTESAIPAAPVSGAPQPYYVKASISGGNANSKLISIGVPLRKYPL